MHLLRKQIVFSLSKPINQRKVFSSVLVSQGQLSNNSINSRSNVRLCQTSSKQNLLRYPAFPLNETLNTFIKSAEPFLTEAELKNTEQDVSNFVSGIGQKLQALLEKTAQKEENWLATRWLRAAYLQYRDPVCVFSSPGMAFPFQKFSTDDEYLMYSAKVIFGALKYKNTIDKKTIPIQKMGKFELDNSQFEKVFGTCRIPGLKEDSMEYHPLSKHVVVIFKNHFYKLPVYTADGKILHPNTIFSQLKEIFQNTKEKATPIGILSSDNRDNWGQAYLELKNIAGNLKSIHEIQQSLFTVSLDQEVPIGENIQKVVSEQLIHGGGSKQNAGNRWFDKTIQVIVNRNGVNGFCYEHAPAEGAAIAMMTDFIMKTIEDNKIDDEADKGASFQKASKLELNISEKLNDFVEKATANVDKLASDLQMNVLHYQGFGKEFLKLHKLSPDSFIQIAIQYAFYKLHKIPGAHYESAHLRIYANGRTETIRSCSNESIKFSKAMLELCSDEKREKLLREAVNSHRQYTNNALIGKGVDRHLLGLKLIALENNIPIPDFFKLPAVVKSAHFRLSTSQVASVNKAYMCYGPLTDDGYGCCYNPRKNDIFFAISSWHHNQETNSEKFSLSLTEALDSMQQLLERSGEKPKSKL